MVSTSRAVYWPGGSVAVHVAFIAPEAPTRPSLARTAGLPGAIRSTRASAFGVALERERHRRSLRHGRRRGGEPAGRRGGRSAALGVGGGRGEQSDEYGEDDDHSPYFGT